MKIEINEENLTLRRLLQLADLTQAELASKTGLSRDAIQRYIAGSRMPSFDNAVLLASALGVSLKVLAKSLEIDVSAVPDDCE